MKKELKDLNWFNLPNRINQVIGVLDANGVDKWEYPDPEKDDCIEVYPIDKLVTFEGDLYISLKNKNSALITDETAWKRIEGEIGPQGPKGDTFTYEDMTPDQLESLKGDVISYNSLTESEKQDLADRVPVNGVVEEGNTEAVSGGEVYDFALPIKSNLDKLIEDNYTVNGFKFIHYGDSDLVLNEGYGIVAANGNYQTTDVYNNFSLAYTTNLIDLNGLSTVTIFAPPPVIERENLRAVYYGDDMVTRIKPLRSDGVEASDYVLSSRDSNPSYNQTYPIPNGARYIRVMWTRQGGSSVLNSEQYITTSNYVTNKYRIDNLESKEEIVEFKNPKELGVITSNVYNLPLKDTNNFRIKFDFKPITNVRKTTADNQLFSLFGFELISNYKSPTTQDIRTSEDGLVKYPNLILGYHLKFNSTIPSVDGGYRRAKGQELFSVRYSGNEFDIYKDLVISFDGVIFKLYHKDTSVNIVNIDVSNMTNVSELINAIESLSLTDIEVITRYRDELIQNIIIIPESYIVSKFPTKGTTNQYDAFAFSIYSGVPKFYTTMEIISINNKLTVVADGRIILQNLTKSASDILTANLNLIDLKNFEIMYNSVGDSEIVGNVYMSKFSPYILTAMAHSVYKIDEMDGVNLLTIGYDKLPIGASNSMPMSLGRLNRLLKTASSKGYYCCTPSEVNDFMNGLIDLPKKRYFCIIHDDHQDYIYKDEDVMSVYNNYNFYPSIAYILNRDYRDVSISMNINRWEAVNHTKNHFELAYLTFDELNEEIHDSYMQGVNNCITNNIIVYPGGSHDVKVREALENKGFTSAFTTAGDFTQRYHNPMLCKRFRADDFVEFNIINSKFI